MVPQKTVKYRGSAPFVLAEMLCNFKNVLGAGMTCSCAPMFKFFSALPDGATTEYQISNCGFSNFQRMYYSDFLNNVYRYGNG